MAKMKSYTAQPDPTIQYADEESDATEVSEERASSAKLLEMTPERNRKNQEAARRVVDQMKYVDPASFRSKKVELPKMTPEEEAKKRARVFFVVEDRKIAKGAASYILRAGKRITENDYDIADLRRQGVRLQEEAALS